ncbi:MAG: glycerophosphodiester phosphodiesterase [Terriglobales bacterium]
MPTLRLGHRGHRCPGWDEPENSLAAFDRALAAGCDGLELDLRHTRDGRVVIHHDEALHGSGLRLAETSCLALRRLHPPLATLEQVLARYRHRAWLDLEIKTEAALVPTLRLLARLPPRRGYVISCFDVEVLHRLAELAPDVPRCLNLKRPGSLRRIRAADVSWVAPHQASCTAWYVQWLHRHGWKVLVWTVNHPRRMQLLARAQAEAIVSDRPDLLVEALRVASLATPPRATASGSGDEQRLLGYPAAGRAPRRVVPQP